MFDWRTILRNALSNWTGYLLTAAISFVLAPMLVGALGKTAYGLWSLILSLTGYFGLLDLGIRSSVGRFVARYISLHDHENASRTVSTAFVMLAAGGAVALLISIGFVLLLFGRFHVGAELEGEGKAALLILAVNVAIVLPMGVFTSVLVAVERFDLINAVTVVAELARAGLVILILRLGFGIAAIAALTLVLSLAQAGFIALAARRSLPEVQTGLRFVNRETFRALAGFSIFRFIWIVSNQLIFYSDSVVIGLFSGPGAIAYYTVAGSLINMGRNYVSLVTDTFTPAAARMDAKQDLEALRNLLVIGTQLALLIALPLCIGFLILGTQFMTLWMGPDFAISGTILAILAVPQITSMSQYTSATVVSAMARHRVLAWLSLAEGIANIALSIILVRRWGVIGVAWGTVIPHLITTAVILPLYTLHIFGMSFRQYLLRAYLRPVICALPVAVLCFGVSRTVDKPTWLIFGAEVALVLGGFYALSYFICLEPEQRASVLSIARRSIQREQVVHEA